MGKKFDVNAFNKLLHGWAQKGNLMSVKLLFKLLKREGLEPDIGTYAALLHGYGKFGDVDGVQSVIKEMEEKVSDFLLINYSVCICLFQNEIIICQLKENFFPIWLPIYTSSHAKDNLILLGLTGLAGIFLSTIFMWAGKDN